MITSGITILLFMLAWNFLWKPTILGYFRDRLFAGRSQLRRDFLEIKDGLSSEAYRFARDRYNNNIHNLDRLSAIAMSYIDTQIEQDDGLRKHVEKRIISMYSDFTEEERALVELHRQRANLEIKLAVINKSFCLFIYFWFSVVTLVLRKLFGIGLEWNSVITEFKDSSKETANEKFADSVVDAMGQMECKLKPA